MLMDWLHSDTCDYIVRICAAALCGAIIGFERDRHGKAAGVRTHLLVSVGSALFTIMSFVIAAAAGQASDPGRIAAQVVTGMGFLGAGTIMKEGMNVRGLTTAACLWTVSAIGMTCGAARYGLAGTATLLTIGFLVGLNYFEQLYHKDIDRVLKITCAHSVDVATLISCVKQHNLVIDSLDLTRNYDDDTTVIRLLLHMHGSSFADAQSSALVNSIEECGVKLKSVKWERP
ncbi:MAG: MgtC/SapB family protein [bacterium]|nr:MgtC/SapB family protein [bacterium]